MKKKEEKTKKHTNIDIASSNSQKVNTNILYINKINIKKNININAKGILLENNKFKVLKVVHTKLIPIHHYIKK